MVGLGPGLRPWLTVGRVTWNITPMVTVGEGLIAFLGILCQVGFIGVAYANNGIGLRGCKT